MKQEDDDLWLNCALDGELGVEASIEMQTRLARDPALKSAWDQQRALRTAIRENAQYHELPAALRARLSDMIATHDPAITPTQTRPNRRQKTLAVANEARRRRIFAAAGALAGAALSAGVTWRILNGVSSTREISQRIAEDAVAGHVRAVMTNRLVDVASSDQHMVKPWLSTQLPFVPQVPDLSAHGFELVGARRDVIDGQEAAVLVYRRRRHIISAFVQPVSNVMAGKPMQRRVVRGFNVVALADGALDYWIVSDLNAHDLGDFVELLVTGV